VSSNLIARSMFQNFKRKRLASTQVMQAPRRVSRSAPGGGVGGGFDEAGVGGGGVGRARRAEDAVGLL
jgi:hypothetical protein